MLRVMLICAVVPALARAQDLDAGLLLHWSFDEGVGRTSADLSGHGRHAALLGDAGWTTGVFGAALQCDGQGAGAAGANDLLFGAESFSLAAWATSMPDAGALQARVVGKDFYSPGSGGWVWLSFGNGFPLLEPQGSAGGDLVRLRSSLPSIDDGRWHHLAAAFDRSTLEFTLYVDGARAGVLPIAAGTLFGRVGDTRPVDVGQQGGGAPLGFPGAIDDVRIYGRALTEREVEALAGVVRADGGSGPVDGGPPIPLKAGCGCAASGCSPLLLLAALIARCAKDSLRRGRALG